MEKILSVSIAAYNVEKYLKRTLKSLEIKDMSPLEIIVVSDGSTDSTVDIAKKFQSKYPDSVVIIDKENGGYGSTINASIPVAKGKYYKQLDGDDWYDTANLEGFIEYLAHIDADIVMSPYYIMRQKSEKKYAQIPQDNHTGVPSEASDIVGVELKGVFLMHEMAIRTELLQKNNVTITEHCFYTDAEYVLQPMMLAKTIARFDKPIYCYRIGIGEQSVSLEGNRKHFADHTTVAKKMFEVFDDSKDGLCENVHNYILNESMVNLASHVYSVTMIMADALKRKKELVAFDRFIKRTYPDIYLASNRSGRIKMLRKTRFVLYPVFCKYELYRFKKHSA